MLNRVLEKYVKVANDEEDTENADRFELEYYLLESGSDCGDPECGRTAYGIEIIKRMDNGSIEQKKFEGLYTDKRRTKELIDVLAANTVTPVSLPYILDDLLSE